MANRYTVYCEYVSGRDGSKSFDNLTDAEIDYEAALTEDNVIFVELSEDSETDGPDVIKSTRTATGIVRL